MAWKTSRLAGWREVELWIVKACELSECGGEMITSVEEMKLSVERDGQPPGELSAELRALWLARAERWPEAHTVAQEIHTSMGSWIHAHLHLIEGDEWNAGYWYRKAGRQPGSPERIEDEWVEIVGAVISAGG